MRKTLDGLITLVSCMVTYSAPAGVASALLWGFLTPGTESSFVDTWRVPLLILLVTFLACVVCGLAGRFQHNAYSVNGCGTTFYGSDEAGPDAVTTKWLTSWGLPLLPIRSYRLVDIALEPGGMPLFLTSP